MENWNKQKTMIAQSRRADIHRRIWSFLFCFRENQFWFDTELSEFAASINWPRHTTIKCKNKRCMRWGKRLDRRMMMILMNFRPLIGMSFLSSDPYKSFGVNLSNWLNDQRTHGLPRNATPSFYLPIFAQNKCLLWFRQLTASVNSPLSPAISIEWVISIVGKLFSHPHWFFFHGLHRFRIE